MSSTAQPPGQTVSRPQTIRLSAPPLVPALLALAAGIVIDRQGNVCETRTYLNLAMAAAGLGVLAVRRPWLSSLTLLFALLALGAGWHHSRWTDRSPDDLSRSVTETPAPAWIRGVVAEFLGVRKSEGYGPGDPDRVHTRMVLSIEQVSEAGLWREASGRALMVVAGDRSDVREGQPVEAAGLLAGVSGPLNPGEFDYRAYLRSREIDLRFSVDNPTGLLADPPTPAWTWTRWLSHLRAACRSGLTAHLSPATSALASALILGQREEIDPEINDAFARTGTTHLLAISGLQLQALAWFLSKLLRLASVPRRPAYLAVAAATVGYSVLVGLAPSVVRSAVMTVAFCLATVVSRPARPANTLALAGLLTLAWNPFFLFDVGCQLSFLAIAALIWLVPRARALMGQVFARLTWLVHRRPETINELERRFEPPWKKRIRSILSGISQGAVTSSVVWLAAVPLVALRFHLVSPIGILLNIPLIPLTTLALLLGASGLGLGMIWDPLGVAPLGAADLLLRLTEAIVRWGGARPWGHRFVAGPLAAYVLAFYAMFALAVVGTVVLFGTARPRSRHIAVLWSTATAVLIPGWMLAGVRPSPPPIEGEMLAVGHGLAIFAMLQDGFTFLYDCGRMGDPQVGRRIIAPALWNRGITRVDQVFLSHADLDHYNALPDLLDRFTIGEVVIPPGFASENNPGATLLLDELRARGVPVRVLEAPASWNRSGVRFTVLHPTSGWAPESSDNARSLVLDLATEGRHLLLTGDLDQEGVVAVCEQPRLEPPVDLMLAPHHGGKTANTPMLYDWARPRTVIVSQRMTALGTTDALTPLERTGFPLLRTWQRGAVHFQWSSDHIITKGFLDQHDQSRSGP